MESSIKNIYSLDLTSLSGIDLNDISEMIDKYPYSHNLHVLQVLASKASSDPDFNKVLNTSAICIPDRAHLKGLIDNLGTITQSISSQDPVLRYDLDLISKPDIPGSISEKEETIVDTDQETEITTSQTIETEEIVDSVPLDLDDDLSAVEDELILDLPEVNVKESVIMEDHVEETNISDQSNEGMEDKSSTKETYDSTTQSEELELSSFSLWLKAKNKSGPTEPTKPEVQIQKANNPDNEWDGLQEKILSEYHGDKHKGKEKDHGQKKKKKLKNKIIETDVVTEPFALLLEKQGKIGKAIKIYEKLSLIYPEKTTYFADKIENLKNK